MKGPGSYEPKLLGRKGPGWSMGKDRRKVFGGKNNYPGPGSYNAKRGCKCDTKGYSFGRKGDPIKPNTTPGFYDVPATIPDVPSYLMPPPDRRKIHL